MAEIYDYTTSQIALNNSPLRYRKTRWQAWFRSLLWPLQWLRDNWFNEYRNGSIAPRWDSLTIYPIGARVIDLYTLGVYERFDNQSVLAPSLNPGDWVMVSPDFRGANERVRYNSQKLILEYILNKYFFTTFRQPDDPVNPSASDIFINQAVPANNFFLVQDGEGGSPIIDGDLFAHEYIMDDNSAASFIYRTIFVPDSPSSPIPGWFTALNVNGDGEKQIRAVVDRYNIAGVLYEIQTY